MDTARRHSRVWRAVKIVGPWRVGVSLVFGAVATVLVAWWIALEPAWMPEFPYGEPVHGNERYWFGDALNADGSIFESVFWTDYGDWAKSYAAPTSTELFERWRGHFPYAKEASSRPSWVGGLDLARDRLPIPGGTWFEEESFGWPFRSFRLQYVTENWQLHEFDCVRVNMSVVGNLQLGTNRVPTGIAVFGFALDMLLYAVPIYLVFSLPMSQTRYWRKKRIQCDTCGYELVGLKGDLCPECGSTIDERRKKWASAVTDS